MNYNLDKLKFNADGLIPAIIQDSRNGQVLMMAYMNRESLEKTLQSGQTWFFSRSRQKLWHKGETSGHTQKVEEVFFDCDADTLLIKVEQHGAACHEGYYSCFHYRLDPSGGVAIVGDLAFNPNMVYGKDAKRPLIQEDKAGNVCPVCPDDPTGCRVMEDLYDLIADRKQQRPSGAYTSYLFDKGLDKILKKVGEESAELIIGAKNHIHQEVVYEAADLLYHVLVLLAEQNIHLRDVMAELQRRRQEP